MNVTEQKLNELYRLRTDIAALEAGTPEKLRLELGEEAYAKLVKVQDEIKAYKTDIETRADKLEGDIKSIALREGKGFQGQDLQVVFSRPSWKWDRDLLEYEMSKDKQFAKKIKGFYEEGKPSVRIIAVGKS